jgi:16S rRNA (cytosine967-C5)-methyltransferase
VATTNQTVSPARAASFDILVRVEREQAYANELLHSKLLDKLSVQDRGLTMEIVMGVLRWRSRLDAAIAQYSFTPFPRLDFEVLTALRIGAYQLEFLRGIPNRAAVNESVMLVKRAKKKSAAALVNVVLRKIATSVASRRQAITEFEPSKANEPMRSTGPLVNRALAGEDAPHFLARQYAHPEWLVKRWIANYGISAAAQICAFNQQVPVTAVRMREERATDGGQSADGVDLASGKLMRSARVVTAGDITHTAVCRDGQVVVQDEGSQLVAALVRPPADVSSPRILDCCAAPGGKTSAIADRNPGATIIAVDLHAHRARLMRQLVRQPNVQIVTADATALPFAGDFDIVLADVPCTGTGTLARNPEIKWRLRVEDIADLHQRQAAILNAAMDRVAPRGRLIYSTCSLEPEENEQVVDEVLGARADFRLIDCADELRRLAAEGELVWDDLASLTRAEYLRTIAGVHPCDGFFAAILQRI